MNTITTYTKKRFPILEPQKEQIDLRDIAHALSLICRANGHFPQFFSVAQHCLNCMHEAAARGYSKKVQLACLLHDAGEAYLADLTRPVKKLLPAFESIESRLLDSIWGTFLPSPLTQEERKLVFCVDDTMLRCEFLHFMEEDICPQADAPVSAPSFALRPFADVEAEFLYAAQCAMEGKKAALTVGVDWKKTHWLAVELQETRMQARCFDTVEQLCAAYSHADTILIDIPIGLPETREEMDRRPDKAARKALPQKRKSSVFPVLYRQIVYAQTKAQAWEENDRLDAGMTVFGEALRPMIRQVDTFLQNNPQWKNRLQESHPEVAFQILNGGIGLQHSKHTPEGLEERYKILTGHGLSNCVKDEDFLDAAALALSAKLGCENGFLTIPPIPYCDSTGLKMQMIFGKTEQ